MARRIDKHGARWRVRWQEDGRSMARTFVTRELAEAYAEQLDQERQARQEEARRRAAPVTVGEVVDAYYERRKRRLQPSTQHHYEHIIRKHIAPKIGSRSARELADDPSRLQDLYDSLPPTTALHVHQILRPAFQYAVDHRRLDRNPCAIAKPARPEEA